MRFTNDEIIGLNSLLDGNNIIGFREKVPMDAGEEYKSQIAEKIANRDKEKVTVALNLLREYKQAEKYMVINGKWYAVRKNFFVALWNVDGEYELIGIDRTILEAQLAMIAQAYAEDINAEETIIRYSPAKWEEELKQNIKMRYAIMEYQYRQSTDLRILYEKEKDRYCLNLLTGECRLVGRKAVQELFDKFGRYERG